MEIVTAANHRSYHAAHVTLNYNNTHVTLAHSRNHSPAHTLTPNCSRSSRAFLQPTTIFSLRVTLKFSHTYSITHSLTLSLTLYSPHVPQVKSHYSHATSRFSTPSCVSLAVTRFPSFSSSVINLNGLTSPHSLVLTHLSSSFASSFFDLFFLLTYNHNLRSLLLSITLPPGPLNSLSTSFFLSFVLTLSLSFLLFLSFHSLLHPSLLFTLPFAFFLLPSLRISFPPSLFPSTLFLSSCLPPSPLSSSNPFSFYTYNHNMHSTTFYNITTSHYSYLLQPPSSSPPSSSPSSSSSLHYISSLFFHLTRASFFYITPSSSFYL